MEGSRIKKIIRAVGGILMITALIVLAPLFIVFEKIEIFFINFSSEKRATLIMGDK